MPWRTWVLVWVDVVGLQMPNVPQYVIAVIAIFKLGATATGVSPLLAPAEVANQLEDAGVKVLVSADTMANATLAALDEQGRLPDCLEAVIVTGIEDLRRPANVELPVLADVRCQTYLALTGDASSEFHQREIQPDHICLIQYTGGTTGKPKGAMLALRQVMNHLFLLHVYRPWDIGKETVVSPFPLFHIGGLAGMMAALRFGARSLLILDPRDLDHLCQQMVEFPPTRLQAVPTLYQAIADHPLSPKIDFSGLRNAQTGSAPITGEGRKRIEDMLKGTALSDCFGLTESGPTILANPPERCKPEAVGMPVPSVDVRIVDVEDGYS